MKIDGTSIFKLAAVMAIGSVPVIGIVKMPNSVSTPVDLPTIAQSSAGRELFLNNCARCHGDDAKGDKGPDLTARKRQSKWANSDEPLIKQITKGGLFMPKFAKKLTPQEIKEIADYVRSLGK